MQHRSTYAGPRLTAQRARRVLSPINAAQRAGYGLDAVPATVTTQPAAQKASAKGTHSPTAKPH